MRNTQHTPRPDTAGSDTSQPDLTRLNLTKLIGPSPLVQGLARWLLGGALCFAAWQIHRVAPLPGLIAVGLAPFVNMYLFFRGLSLMHRGILHWKTSRAATRLHLAPDWGSCGGGYLLVDESRGVWVANGASGTLDALADVTCRVRDQAFLLDLHEDKDAAPVVSVGMGDAQEMEAVAARLVRAVAEHKAQRPRDHHPSSNSSSTRNERT